jgi:hypothetical protein
MNKSKEESDKEAEEKHQVHYRIESVLNDSKCRNGKA